MYLCWWNRVYGWVCWMCLIKFVCCVNISGCLLDYLCVEMCYLVGWCVKVWLFVVCFWGGCVVMFCVGLRVWSFGWFRLISFWVWLVGLWFRSLCFVRWWFVLVFYWYNWSCLIWWCGDIYWFVWWCCFSFWCWGLGLWGLLFVFWFGWLDWFFRLDVVFVRCLVLEV